MIATGSELLLLIEEMRDVVGSVVLPILGAVPDGAIVLFSGMGPNAQEEVAIGVGALAGSTIMLLTIPWFLSILAGRVNIRLDGEVMYRHKPRLWPANNFSLLRTGVAPKGMVRTSGVYMLITSLSYVFIQFLAFGAGTPFVALQTKTATMAAAASEHYGAAFVLALCVFFFGYYIFSQFNGSPEKADNLEAMLEELIKSRVADKSLSLSAAFNELWTLSVEEATETSGLVDMKKKRLNNVLRYFFSEFDSDKNGHIDDNELSRLMTDLGERLTESELQDLHNEIDADRSGTVSLEEFSLAIPKFIRMRAAQGASPGGLAVARPNGASAVEEGGVSPEPEILDAHEDSDEEEVPEDLKHDDPKTERRRILMSSFRQMAFGTLLVLIFSDPMVGVMSDMGRRLDISAFYISFVLAPLASNASEVIAAYKYAMKKTRRTVTISLSTLLGAAILNNTFVLAIFMLLIVVKGLAWQFTAETVAILLVELVMGWMSQRRTQTLADGFLVLSLFPLSIFLVAFLENVVGLD